MRRISTGVQGRPILGKYFSVDNVLSTLETNTDIRLEPSGSGKVVADADLRISAGNSLEIQSDTTNRSVNLIAPSGLGSNLTLTLPSDTGAAGEALTVDGSGNLSFVNLAVTINNQTADTTSYFPTLTTSTSGGLNSISVSSSKLSFQPSSGTMTTVKLVADTLEGNGSAITNLPTPDNITISEDSSTNGTFHPTFVSGTSGTRNVESDNDLTYNPSLGELTATLVTASSDERLKTEIKTIDSALEKISSLRGVTFTRKQTFNKELGLIAQEVEKIIPEAVTSNEKGFKSIAYGNLVGVLIEAIKEQNYKIAELENRI